MIRRLVISCLLLLAVAMGFAAAGFAGGAAPASVDTVWWARRAAAENWLLERTLVLTIDCGPPACDPAATLTYRSTVDSATCRGKGQYRRSGGVIYWHLFSCQVEATPLASDSMVPTLVELKPAGAKRFAYRIIDFDAP